jgi:hypothetical protein
MKGAMPIVTLIIAVFLAIIIATALLPTIADQTIGVSGTGNITGVTATIVDLIPLFYAIGIILIVLGSLKITGKV